MTTPPHTAATPTGGGTGQLANVDPCALLTAAELATVMNGTPTPQRTGPATTGGLTQATCDWNTTGEKVSVYIVAGLPSDQLALSFAAKSNDAHGHTADGVGDKAWIFSDIPADCEVDAIIGGIGFTVDLLATGANGMQDKVLALARAVASRV